MVTNVLGTQTLLDAAHARTGSAGSCTCRTDEVYGSIETAPGPRTGRWRPTRPYSAAKAGSDLIALAYHRTHGLDVVVTRCSNNYGPYQFPEKVIPLFVTNLLDGGTVPLYGDGRQRPRLAARRRPLPPASSWRCESGRAGEVYNIGGGTELTNRELTERLLDGVRRATGTAVEQVADRKGHDRRYSLDITKISDELGYAPQVTFDDGLAETVAWYRDNRAWWEPLKARAARDPLAGHRRGRHARPGPGRRARDGAT